MGKNKHKRFRENETFTNMIQPEFGEYFRTHHPLRSNWNREVFGNDNPIVLELGCGRGEYTVALALKYPDRNFIGVDIKGARMWRGAKTATEEGISNAAFLRTRIEFIDSFFGPDEVSEVWITFPDPQLKKKRVSKRLTSPEFLTLYSRFLTREAFINLKTDSRHLHDYTRAVTAANDLLVEQCFPDIYGTGSADDILSVKTAYEEKFLKQGLPITYLRFNLNGRTRFAAPYFEADEYLETIREE